MGPKDLLLPGPPLEEAPAVLDKPDIVYVVEGQPASVTVTFNHVEAQVVWRRWGPALHAPFPQVGVQFRHPSLTSCGWILGDLPLVCPLAAEGPS